MRTTLKNGASKITARCTCGGYLSVTSYPPEPAENIHRLWLTWHPYPAHKPKT